MIDIKVDGIVPEHVDRLTPQMSVDASGKITWVPGFIDYNANNFYRGKQIDYKEFNELLLKSVYQGNYLTDSLNTLVNDYLGQAIYSTFTNAFKLSPSYIKVFGVTDWSEPDEDGYYTITIPASEHGFEIAGENVLDRMNIDTELYLLDSNNNFYEVSQVLVDTQNNVTIYTDDNTLVGFVVIRTNDKAYRIADTTTVPVANIIGLANVAKTGKATDLIDYTKSDGTGISDRITRNANNINNIILGTTEVAKATDAKNAQYATNLLASGNIQNIPISNIFEEGSSVVRQARKAAQDLNGNDIASTYATKTALNTLQLNVNSSITTLQNNVDTALKKTIQIEKLNFTQKIITSGDSKRCVITFLADPKFDAGDILQIDYNVGAAPNIRGALSTYGRIIIERNAADIQQQQVHFTSNNITQYYLKDGAPISYMLVGLVSSNSTQLSLRLFQQSRTGSATNTASDASALLDVRNIYKIKREV